MNGPDDQAPETMPNQGAERFRSLGGSIILCVRSGKLNDAIRMWHSAMKDRNPAAELIAVERIIDRAQRLRVELENPTVD